MDELYEYLEKKNAKITDFRKAVIELSHPKGSNDTKNNDTKKNDTKSNDNKSNDKKESKNQGN